MADLEAVNRALVASGTGWPPLSSWWLTTFARFLSTAVRQIVLRVGRRGGKSSSLVRFAVAFALTFDCRKITAGDTGIVGIVSVTKTEAAARVKMIKQALTTLKVPFRPTPDGIELLDRPIAFKVFAATVGAVVGGTWILAICDEVSRWRDEATGANPAKEVLASLRPTMATQPDARLFLSSSPLSTLDAHYDAFELGDTPAQIVAYAPTWIANPTLTEEELRRDEPEPRTFAREYQAIPMAAISSAFNPEHVDAAMKRTYDENAGDYHEPVMVLDPSSGRGDAFTSAFFQWFTPHVPREAFVWNGRVRAYIADYDGVPMYGQIEIPETDEHGNPLITPEWEGKVMKPSLIMSEIDARVGRFYPHLSSDMIVDSIAARCREWDMPVFSDQREAFALEAAFKRRGVKFTSIAWTAPDKVVAVDRLRRLLAEEQIVLPHDEDLRREMYAYSERVMPSGTITYAARSAAKDDRVALIITACMADAEGALRGSPARIGGGRKRGASLEARQTQGATE